MNAWLRRRGDTVVPQRERSLDIFGDEKVLDGVVFGSWFGAGRLTYQMLLCKPCRPPVHLEILGDGPWLLVENWTTFKTLASHARRTGWDGRPIAAVLAAKEMIVQETVGVELLASKGIVSLL